MDKILTFYYQLQKSNINMNNGHSRQEHVNKDTIWFLSPDLGQFFANHDIRKTSLPLTFQTFPNLEKLLNCYSINYLLFKLRGFHFFFKVLYIKLTTVPYNDTYLCMLASRDKPG